MTLSSIARLHAVAFILACAACTRAPVQEAMPPLLAPEVKLVGDATLFVTGKAVAPDAAIKLGAALKSGTLGVDAFVDELLSGKIDGGFAKDLILGGSQGIKDGHPVPRNMVLHSENGVYRLRAACAAADAVSVDAWWGETVKVCPDAYRPEVTGDAQARTCGASFLSPALSEVCGCGPRLMWCTRDVDHWNRVKVDVQREVTDTVGWVVNNDLPLAQLFTMNETVRNDNTESVYRRARVLSGEPAEKVFDRSDFPKGSGPQPRHEQVPGQHAGILTAPSMIFGSDALRGVMRNYFDFLWCTSQSSSRVTTEAVLGLDVVDLRVGDGWKQLASMKVCTDCHARLDYGMQFFHGWPSSTQGVDFQVKDHLSSKGGFYSSNIKDLRGEGDLNPRAFAQLAVAQPEFGDCMSRRVADHVFNGSHRPDDIAAIKKTFAEKHTLRSMLRTALVRYASAVLQGRAPEAAVAPSSADLAAAPRDAAVVKVPASLRRRIDNTCMECHDVGDTFDFNGDELPRQTLAHMLEQVGFGLMPKTAEGLPASERQAIVRELATVLFDDTAERQVAIEWFGSAFRPHAVHRFRSAMDSVAARAGAKSASLSIRAVETAVEQAQMVYSPTMAVSSGLTALKTCRSAFKSETEVQRCVEKASAPEAIVAGDL